MLLEFLRNLFVHRRRRSALDSLELERTDAVELGLLEPRKKIGEILLSFAGKADDEARADSKIGDLRSPVADALQHLCVVRGTAHSAEDIRARMLEWDVQIGKDQPFRHQRNHVVHVRVGVDVMQSHPGPDLAQLA